MLPLILNAIYRQFLQAALPGISSEGARLFFGMSVFLAHTFDEYRTRSLALGLRAKK
ncbi:MAG: hypothetical protein ACREEK_32530 [Bradyrhizobium sp.]